MNCEKQFVIPIMKIKRMYGADIKWLRSDSCQDDGAAGDTRWWLMINRECQISWNFHQGSATHAVCRSWRVMQFEKEMHDIVRKMLIKQAHQNRSEEWPLNHINWFNCMVALVIIWSYLQFNKVNIKVTIWLVSIFHFVIGKNLTATFKPIQIHWHKLYKVRNRSSQQ